MFLSIVFAPGSARSEGRTVPAAPVRYQVTHGRLVAVDRTGARVQVAAVGVVCDRAQLMVAGRRLVYRGRFCGGVPIDKALNHARLV